MQKIANWHKRENPKKRNQQKKQNELNSKSDKRSPLLDPDFSHTLTMTIMMLNLTPPKELL